MLEQRPRILTPEESAFAAKHFAAVYAFLAKNGLSEDEYYDPALNGFLKAVQSYPAAGGSIDFDRFAAALMSAECTAYEESLHNASTVIRFSDCVLEETIADAKNTIDEAIAAIALEETMQSFDAAQRRIVQLLCEGYSKPDIAAMLQMSMAALFEEIRLIQNKTRTSPIMLAA